MLRTRLWTALAALPTVLAIIVFAPDGAFTALIALLTAFGLYEIGGMNGIHRPLQLAALVAAGSVPALLLLTAKEVLWVLPASVIVVMLATIARVAIVGPEHRADDARLSLIALGVVYVAVLFPYFAILRSTPRGVQLFVLFLLLVVASDTGAYFAGVYLGRIKLAPKVSPNKTVEGALGGLVCCLAVALVLRAELVPWWSIRYTVFAASAIGALAQLGDMACSAYKRVVGVKDSGWLFPGHGGLLDRASGLVFAVVFTYYFSR